MNKIKKYPYISLLIACDLILLAFFFLTNPEQVPIGLLVLPVVLIFLIVYSATHLVLEGLRKLQDRPGKRRAVSVIAGCLVAVLMILQSSGGLSGIDLVLMGLIIAVTALYVSRY